MTVRLTRAEQAAANRSTVLAAALTVFLRAGYHGTTVEAIAREAGFTIGALYSRFAGKADLYLALLEQRIDLRAEQFAVGPVSLTDDAPREFARRWAAVLRDERDWSLLAIEFRVHAARDPELNARYAALHERAVRALAANITTSLPSGVDVPAARVTDMARAALALSTGAAVARAAEGDAFSDGLYEELALALGERFLKGE